GEFVRGYPRIHPGEGQFQPKPKCSRLALVVARPLSWFHMAVSYAETSRGSSSFSSVLSCASLLLSLLALHISAQADGKLQQADSLYQRYRQTDDQGALKQAAALLDALQQAEPDNYDVLWRRGRVYYSLGDDAKANSEKLKLFDQA